MMDFDDVLDRSEDRTAFSNGSEYDVWEYNRCLGASVGRSCVHSAELCPIAGVILLGRTPAELSGEHPRYTCSEYTPEDDTT